MYRNNLILTSRSILMGAFLVLYSLVNAQEEITQDTIPPAEPQTITSEDTLIVDEGEVLDTIILRDHSPKKAIIYSAILPGLGQAYNRKYWKIPIIYGTGFVLYYFIDTYGDLYQRYKKSYNELYAGEPISDQEIAGRYPPDYDESLILDNLALNRDSFRKYRDLNIIFMGILYFANIVDAMVDAHLYQFDISDDLTLRWEPTLINQNYSENYFASSCGVKLSLRF